jgi:hypothetical protein
LKFWIGSLASGYQNSNFSRENPYFSRSPQSYYATLLSN